MKELFTGGLLISISIAVIAGAFAFLLLYPESPYNPFGRFTVVTQVAEGKITYAYGNGQLLASQGSDNQLKYYITDHLGSIRKVTDSSGNIVSSNDYIAFGSVKSSEGSSRYKFTGKELDESGLYYYGARYYDSDIGRFVTVDTVKGDSENPQSLNRYSYTLNNPLKYIDPKGEQGIDAGKFDLREKPTAGLLPPSLPKKYRKEEWETHTADKPQHFVLGFAAEKASDILVSDILGLKSELPNYALRTAITTAIILTPEFTEKGYGGKAYFSWEDVGFAAAGALYAGFSKGNSVYPSMDLGKDSKLTLFTAFLPDPELTGKYGSVWEASNYWNSYSRITLQTPVENLGPAGKVLEKLGIDTFEVFLRAERGLYERPYRTSEYYNYVQ